jgi:hypothetical protein
MRVITDPMEMVVKVTNRNIGLFAQAQGTPFTSDELQDLFGYKGTTDAVEALLNNNEIPTGLMAQPEAVMDILNELGKGKLRDIEAEITCEEFTSGIHKWK